MNKLTLAAVSALSAVTFSPLPSEAETIGVVAVAEPPGPSAELAELTHQLRAVAAERAKGVLEAGQLRDRMTGQTSTASLAELDRAYAGALATYQNGDFEGAVRTLRAVVDDLEKLPDSPEAFSQWTRAMLRLARAEQTLGHKDEARAVIERLVRAAPDVKVDPTQYPPSFERQIAESRNQVKALPTGKLTVNATAKGAKVYVDGREVGPAPVTVTLPRGRYRVSGSLGSLRVPSQMVDLSAEGHTVTLNFVVAEALRPSFGPGLALPEADRAKSIVTAGGFLGVDFLMASSMAKQGDVDYLVGSYYDVRKGSLLREGRVRLSNRTAPSGSLTALVSFLITGQQSSLVATTAPAAKPVEGPAKPPPSLQARPPERPELTTTARAEPSRALGYTAFTTGVLTIGAGVFGVIEILQSNGKYDDAKALLNPDNTLKSTATPTQYNQLVSDGDSARKLGVIGLVGAGALAVTTGVLAVLSGGDFGVFRF